MPQQAATTASVTPVQPSFPAPGAAFMTTGTTPEVRRPRGGKPSNRHLLLAHLGIVAATYAAFWAGKQASESKSSRHASTALEMASRWGAPDLIQSPSAVAEYAREGRLAEKFMAARAVQSDAYYEISRLMDFFEDLAALEMIGGISLDWVCLTMKPSVLEYWGTVWYTVDEMRKDEPEAYVCFECLVQKVRQAGKRGKQ